MKFNIQGMDDTLGDSAHTFNPHNF